MIIMEKFLESLGGILDSLNSFGQSHGAFAAGAALTFVMLVVFYWIMSRSHGKMADALLRNNEQMSRQLKEGFTVIEDLNSELKKIHEKLDKKDE